MKSSTSTPFLLKATKRAARDAAFLFVYQMLKGTFEDQYKDSMKVFNAVKYIVSHCAVFKYTTRVIIRAAYEERYHISEKQVAELISVQFWNLGKMGAWRMRM
jgi:hypothetical protein